MPRTVNTASRSRAETPWRRAPTYASVTATVADIVLAPRRRGRWLALFAIALAFTLLFVGATVYLLAIGVGIWGIDVPVVWGFAITNYVWWIGIGMAGTFISAALLLLRQPWRTSINRFAEAMTVFAVAIAALFPILHLGRPWFFYWLAPYPDKMGVWPQWRSALTWDFFAILAYLVVSLLFWYLGMLPDLAALRDRATTHRAQVFYGVLALGWRGEARHWQRHEVLMGLLAGLAVPLVFSVHSMVAMDFAEGIGRGWHSTLFPPFFVAGALFSGFAVVLALAIPLRAALGLTDFITDRHLDHLARILLAAGLVVAYSYVMDVFMAFYSGEGFEIDVAIDRMTGTYAPVYWATVVCNVIALQALWFRAVRRSPAALFIVSVLIIAGMWLERFMLIVSTLHHSFLPSSWGTYAPTFWDWAHFLGSLGLFAFLFLLFLRLLPLMAIGELRALVHKTSRP